MLSSLVLVSLLSTSLVSRLTADRVEARNLATSIVDEHPRARNCVAPIGKTVGAQCARFNKPNQERPSRRHSVRPQATRRPIVPQRDDCDGSRKARVASPGLARG